MMNNYTYNGFKELAQIMSMYINNKVAQVIKDGTVGCYTHGILINNTRTNINENTENAYFIKMGNQTVI